MGKFTKIFGHSDKIPDFLQSFQIQFIPPMLTKFQTIISEY